MASLPIFPWYCGLVTKNVNLPFDIILRSENIINRRHSTKGSTCFGISTAIVIVM